RAPFLAASFSLWILRQFFAALPHQRRGRESEPQTPRRTRGAAEMAQPGRAVLVQFELIIGLGKQPDMGPARQLLERLGAKRLGSGVGAQRPHDVGDLGWGRALGELERSQLMTMQPVREVAGARG